MNRLACTGAMLLAGCGSSPVASDGYAFGDPTWVQTDLRITVVLVPTVAELRRIGPPVADGRALMAFAKVSPDGRCIIYKVDSRTRYEPEWDGHELNHCIYGSWHP